MSQGHLTTLSIGTVLTEPDLAAVFPFPSFNGMQCQLLGPILHSDSSLVVAAPKTVLFELAIVLHSNRVQHIIYMYSKRTHHVYMYVCTRHTYASVASCELLNDVLTFSF